MSPPDSNQRSVVLLGGAREDAARVQVPRHVGLVLGARVLAPPAAAAAGGRRAEHQIRGSFSRQGTRFWQLSLLYGGLSLSIFITGTASICPHSYCVLL